MSGEAIASVEPGRRARYVVQADSQLQHTGNRLVNTGRWGTWRQEEVMRRYVWRSGECACVCVWWTQTVVCVCVCGVVWVGCVEGGASKQAEEREERGRAG